MPLQQRQPLLRFGGRRLESEAWRIKFVLTLCFVFLFFFSSSGPLEKKKQQQKNTHVRTECCLGTYSVSEGLGRGCINHTLTAVPARLREDSGVRSPEHTQPRVRARPGSDLNVALPLARSTAGAGKWGCLWITLSQASASWVNDQ